MLTYCKKCAGKASSSFYTCLKHQLAQQFYPRSTLDPRLYANLFNTEVCTVEIFMIGLVATRCSWLHVRHNSVHVHILADHVAVSISKTATYLGSETTLVHTIPLLPITPPEDNFWVLIFRPLPHRKFHSFYFRVSQPIHEKQNIFTVPKFPIIQYINTIMYCLDIARNL